ncbi:MAG: hypothetical protein JWQ20_617 [Conexibacter sp.]|nr:hypothetical protein [Conexibacter sp.]
MKGLHPTGRGADLMGVMRRTTRRGPNGPSRLIASEAGFALIEVMVSAVLLIVLALSTLSVIDRAQGASSNNRSRDVAAQIAQSEQDTIRQMPITALAGGYHPGPVAKTVGGITYTVDSTAIWVQDSGGPVACSTKTGRVEYLQTATTVTWPGMGTIKPVTADGIVAPGVAALGANKGSLTVLLSKADGTGTPGITVTAGGVSAVTDENGCAVLGNLDAGPQTLTYSQPGYVDKDSINAVSKPVTIGSGTIAQATGYYDHPGTINVSLFDDATPAASPTWPKVSFDHVQHSSPTTFTLSTTASQPAISAGVFPFSSPYKVYVGDCTGNDPSNPLYTNAGAPSGAQVNPGEAKPVALTMRRITVHTAPGATVFVAPETASPPMASCTAQTVGTWTADAAGIARVPVPYGVWRVCGALKRGNGQWAQSSTNNANVPTTDDAPISTPATTTGTYAPVLDTTLANIPNTGTKSPPLTC